LVEAAEIWLFKVLVDDVLVAGDLGRLPGVLLLFVVLNVVAGALGFGDAIVSTWARESVRLRLRNDLFGHLLRLTPVQAARRRTGDLLTTLTSDVADVTYLVVSVPKSAVEAVVRIGAFVGMLFYLDWMLAVASLAVAPLFWRAATRFTSRLRSISTERRRRTGELAAHAAETLTAVAQVQAAGAVRYEEDRFDTQGRAIRDAGMDATKLTATLRPLADLLELCGALLVIGLGAWSVVEGRLTLGELLAFLTYLTQLYSPVRTLTTLAASAGEALAGAERVAGILDEAPAVTEPAHPIRRGHVEGVIGFDGVTFTYPGRDRPALDGVDLDILPGEVTAIVGPSGSGKSTLAALAARLIDPDAGSVLLDGEDLRSYPLDMVRSSVTLLLQDTHLFHGSIAANVAYGIQAATEDVMAALDEADASFVTELGGPEHHIGGSGHALSGGQRRRVALARALLAATPVLILDEFSTGQDPASVRRVLERLRRRVATIVLITHDPAVAACADRIVVLAEGRVIDHGQVPGALTLAGPSR
jgi:ABC-type multidrug transport system fused ATPase/permease subunit